MAKAIALAGVPADASLVASMPSVLQGYIRQTVGQIDRGGMDDESLWEIGIRGLQMEMAGRLLAGRAFVELSRRVERGQIVERVRQLGISTASFYDACSIYRTFEALPDGAAVASLAALGHSKVREIARCWQPEEAAQFAGGQQVRGLTIEVAADMPVRELVAAIKQHEPKEAELAKLATENTTLQTKLETAQKSLERLSTATVLRINATRRPEFCIVAREEAVLAADQIALALDAMEAIVREKLTALPDEVVDAETHAAVAAGTLYHALLAVHLRSKQLLADLANQFGEEVTGRLQHEHQLTPVEADIARQNLARLAGRLKTQQMNRDAERHNAKGGRGRPRAVRAEA